MAHKRGIKIQKSFVIAYAIVGALAVIMGTLVASRQIQASTAVAPIACANECTSETSSGCRNNNTAIPAFYRDNLSQANIATFGSRAKKFKIGVNGNNKLIVNASKDSVGNVTFGVAECWEETVHNQQLSAGTVKILTGSYGSPQLITTINLPAVTLAPSSCSNLATSTVAGSVVGGDNVNILAVLGADNCLPEVAAHLSDMLGTGGGSSNTACTNTNKADDRFTKGVVLNGSTVVASDSCAKDVPAETAPNPNFLLEALCVNNLATAVIHDCGSNGCSNGACNRGTGPTISNIADQTTSAGTAVGPIQFTVFPASVTVRGASNNSSVVPNNNIVFTGSGANRTVTVTPAPNMQGLATITVTVSNGSQEASDTFNLSVTNSPACDSDTDGGDKPNDYGSTRYQGGVVNNDWCEKVNGVNTGKLREYFCDATGHQQAKWYTCANGCSDGACRTLCTEDTDGGDVPLTKGTIKNGTATVTPDWCGANSDGTKFLAEYLCVPDATTGKSYVRKIFYQGCNDCVNGASANKCGTSSACTGTKQTFQNGLTAANFSNNLLTQPFIDAGMTVYNYSFGGQEALDPETNTIRRRWLITPADLIPTFLSGTSGNGLGYYVYNPGSSKEICLKPAGTGQGSDIFLRRGWNLLANTSGSAKTMAEFSYLTVNEGADNTCNATGCATRQTLRQLLAGDATGPEARRLFTTIPVIVNPTATDNSAFRYDHITPTNAEIYTIPGHTSFWVFLFE